MYNYDKLNGRIKEKCKTQSNFAKKMGLSERTVSKKLNNEVPFKQPDIARALEVLELDENDIQAYFFNLKVQ